MAVRFARDGYDIGLAARRENLLEEVAAQVREVGARAAVFPCDVADRDQVVAAVAGCEEELGPVDLLIANAGVSSNTPVDPFDSRAVERVIRINLLGAVYATEAVLPGMLERDGGQVVAMSSIAGFAGLPMTGAYSASKGAMTNFFESLRIDLRKTGVAVTVITPGFVKSPMTDRNRHAMPFLMDAEPAVEKMFRAIKKRKKSLAFPWPLYAVVWAARLLPRPWYDSIAGRIDRRKDPEPE